MPCGRLFGKGTRARKRWPSGLGAYTNRSNKGKKSLPTGSWKSRTGADECNDDESVVMLTAMIALSSARKYSSRPSFLHVGIWPPFNEIRILLPGTGNDWTKTSL